MKGEDILNSDRKHPPIQFKLTVENLSQAIFIVNRHAKTATNPKFLYKLKHEALKKLLQEGKAKKVGLHFSENPKNSQQQSDVLVACGNYTFHIPPSKNDFAELPHLGKLDHHVRNPKASLSLNMAKAILSAYTGLSDSPPPPSNKNRSHHAYQKPIFKKLGERYS
ncbi:YkyB family protein [Bacillota bacterium Lsc_1132]